MEDQNSVGDQLLESMKEFNSALKARDFSPLTVRSISLELHPTTYNPELVQKTRQVLGVSQALFAQFLGVKKGTVCAWEQGENKPSEMACRFMDEIRHDPEHWRRRLLDSIKSKENNKEIEPV